MPIVRLVLLILAIMLFVLAGLEVKVPRVDLPALGLALLALALLLGERP